MPLFSFDALYLMRTPYFVPCFVLASEMVSERLNRHVIVIGQALTPYVRPKLESVRRQDGKTSCESLVW